MKIVETVGSSVIILDSGDLRLLQRGLAGLHERQADLLYGALHDAVVLIVERAKRTSVKGGS